METAISIIFTLFYDMAFLFFIVVMLFCLCTNIQSLFSKGVSLGNKILDCAISLLFVGVCAFCVYGSVGVMYTFTNKTFGNPKPSCQIELFENGEKMIQYQDTTHLCNAKDENSTWFKSRIPVNRKPSRKDVCDNCGRDYTHHDTYEEQRFFDAVSKYYDCY